jgi:hypothetical protein
VKQLDSATVSLSRAQRKYLQPLNIARRLAQLVGRARQQREGAPVHRDHALDAQQLNRIRRLARSHREHIANRQHRHIGLIQLADDAHIAEYAGVARVIERQPVLQAHHIARRLARVDHLPALLQTAAVEGIHHRDGDAVNRHAAAFIHRLHLLHPVPTEVQIHLVDARNRRLIGLRNRHGVRAVVGVPVRDQHNVHAWQSLGVFGAGRVALHPRVNQNPLAAW